MLRVSNWVASAYREICTKHTNWKFLRSSFSVNTVAGTEAYAPTDCTDSVLSAAIGSATVGEFASWIEDTFRMYKQSEGAGARQYFWPVPYEWFRDRYQLVIPANARPEYWGIRPRDNALLIGPKPNDVYVVEGDYYRMAPDLTVDASTPLFPARFHEAIVWLATMKYAGYEEAGGVWAHASSEYGRIYGMLEIDQLPEFQLPAPLA